ncbi:MAG: adaptor protein MecA [Lachnospiraceae bacterium]|nr:adaptor protein MecA [Lachnospiraceae bacterium]
MKIEKVNEQQIRCTLTREDLADRELKISELAYGTEKAKNLFRDMMQQAAYECGFEAEDIPLMIEAIPLNAECIVLIITKVEDPEELDTRFSKFAPSVHNEDDEENEENEELMEAFGDSADEMLDMLRKMEQYKESSVAEGAAKKEAKEDNRNRIYSFPSLRVATRAAHILSPLYDGVNSLYKDNASGAYLLTLDPLAISPEDSNRMRNVLLEYGRPEVFSKAVEAHLNEHYELIIKDKAIQSLASI